MPASEELLSIRMLLVPEGYEIGFDLEGDKKKFTVTESGIVVIAKNQVLTKLQNSRLQISDSNG
jgi:hypothetical protein